MDQLGEAFARALAAKDEDGLRDVLAPDVDFRALTPGQTWEADAVEEVLEVAFGSWISEDDEVLGLTRVWAGAPVEDTSHVGYRLALRTPDGDYTVEQQGYYRVEDGRIAHLRLVCSGYRPVHPASP